MKHQLFCIVLVVSVLGISSCHKDSGAEVPDHPGKGYVEIRFRHVADTNALVLDSGIYYTAAGNMFRITDLRYFVSHLTFAMHGGGKYTVKSNQGIHYTDLRLPETLRWNPTDLVPAGSYDSVSFTFGLDQLDNTSNRFPDPPERDMFWPDILGGGYHYMQMNTMWKDSVGLMQPFMLHLGIGQTYAGSGHNIDSITGYVQNYFTVKLPSSAFTLAEGQTEIIELFFHADRWLDGPPVQFDLADMPQGIMQYEELMSQFCLNGRGAFTVSIHD